MELRQTIRKKGEMLIMDFPLWMRIILGAIALLMIVPMITYGHVYIVPALIAAISGFGALYVEKWVFDMEAGTITNDNGLLFASKTNVVNIADVDGVKVQAPAPAAGKKARFRRLVLMMKDVDPLVLDVQKSEGDLKKNADLIAAATGLRRLDDSI